MLVDRKNAKMHAPWLALVVSASLGATLWYLLASRGSQRWPGGSSLPGLVFGIVASAIIVFELLLWPRRWIRAWRLGSAQLWMRAHIWLGLLSLPLVILHTGWTWGGSFTTLLLALFLCVIASGLFGLALQQVLPRLLLREVSAETIASQIEVVARQNAADAEQFVTALCGPRMEAEAHAPAYVPEAQSGHLVIGAVRRAGSVGGRVLQTDTPRVKIHAPVLRRAFDAQIRPYLVEGRRGSTTLSDPRRARLWFDDLESHLGDEARPVVEPLRSWCDQRRQFELQRRLHAWLHAWLAVHLPLSVALVILLAWHVYTALMYW